MNPLKERTALTTKAITTLLASVLVASFAGTMLSMPQMIQSVNAQSEEGSENACKGRGELEKGRCTGPAESVSCEPTKVGGQDVKPISDTRCQASGTNQQIASECNKLKNEHPELNVVFKPGSGGRPPTPATCTFDVTVICPGGGEPIGLPSLECISKPGNRT